MSMPGLQQQPAMPRPETVVVAALKPGPTGLATPALRPGQVLEARVMGTGPTGLTQLAVAGKLLHVQLSLPLPAGTTLQLQVQPTGPNGLPVLVAQLPAPPQAAGPLPLAAVAPLPLPPGPNPLPAPATATTASALPAGTAAPPASGAPPGPGVTTTGASAAPPPTAASSTPAPAGTVARPVAPSPVSTTAPGAVASAAPAPTPPPLATGSGSAAAPPASPAATAPVAASPAAGGAAALASTVTSAPATAASAPLAPAAQTTGQAAPLPAGAAPRGTAAALPGAPAAPAVSQAAVPASAPASAPAAAPTPSGAASAAPAATGPAPAAAMSRPALPMTSPILAASAGLAPANLSQATQAAARQDSLAPLLQNLSALHSRLGELPRPAMEAALRLLGNRISADRGAPDGATLKQAVQRSGIFLEAAARPAAAQAAPPADTKAALLQLRGALTAWLGEAVAPVPPVTARPQPPTRGAQPRGHAADQPNLPPGATPQEAGRLLLGQAEGALSRMRLHQLASLPPDPARAGQLGPAAAAEWNLEIPLLLGPELAMMQLQIARDAKGRGERRERGWRMAFSLNFSAIGEVGAQVSLLGQSTSVAIWADEPETAAVLTDMLPELTAALTAKGLAVGAVRVRQGRPAAPAPPSGQLLDSTR